MVRERDVDFASLAVRDLLALSAACVAELRGRGVVRTGNAPLGDYIEWLAVRALGGKLAPNSERSIDLTTAEGRRIQVKSRRVSDPPTRGQLQTSPFRSWGFDDGLFVLVDEATFAVRRASLVPVAAVKELSIHRPHVNGAIVFMTDDLMAHERASEVTNDLRAAADDAPILSLATPEVHEPHGSREPARVGVNDQRNDPSAAGEVDWIWLTGTAINEFKAWRIRGGASAASASSYASGARAFVQYCRTIEADPASAVDAFHDHLVQTRDLAVGVRSDYRSHARAFVRFLEEAKG